MLEYITQPMKTSKLFAICGDVTDIVSEWRTSIYLVIVKILGVIFQIFFLKFLYLYNFFRHNFCRGNFDEIKQRTQDLYQYWILPNFKDVTPEWEHMTRCLVEPINYYPLYALQGDDITYYGCVGCKHAAFVCVNVLRGMDAYKSWR